MDVSQEFGVICCATFSHHIVGICMTERKADDEPGDPDEKTFVWSAFVISVQGIWFLLTAGHVLEIILDRKRKRRTLGLCLLDGLASEPSERFDGIPFPMEIFPHCFVNDEDERKMARNTAWTSASSCSATQSSRSCKLETSGPSPNQRGRRHSRNGRCILPSRLSQSGTFRAGSRRPPQNKRWRQRATVKSYAHFGPTCLDATRRMIASTRQCPRDGGNHRRQVRCVVLYQRHERRTYLRIKQNDQGSYTYWLVAVQSEWDKDESGHFLRPAG